MRQAYRGHTHKHTCRHVGGGGGGEGAETPSHSPPTRRQRVRIPRHGSHAGRVAVHGSHFLVLDCVPHLHGPAVGADGNVGSLRTHTQARMHAHNRAWDTVATPTAHMQCPASQQANSRGGGGGAAPQGALQRTRCVHATDVTLSSGPRSTSRVTLLVQALHRYLPGQHPGPSEVTQGHTRSHGGEGRRVDWRKGKCEGVGVGGGGGGTRDRKPPSHGRNKGTLPPGKPRPSGTQAHGRRRVGWQTYTEDPRPTARTFDEDQSTKFR
jgi:hypothetical protein